MLLRDHGQLPTVHRVELPQQRRHIGLHSSDRQEQSAANLSVVDRSPRAASTSSSRRESRGNTPSSAPAEGPVTVTSWRTAEPPPRRAAAPSVADPSEALTKLILPHSEACGRPWTPPCVGRRRLVAAHHRVPTRAIQRASVTSALRPCPVTNTVRGRTTRVARRAPSGRHGPAEPQCVCRSRHSPRSPRTPAAEVGGTTAIVALHTPQPPRVARHACNSARSPPDGCTTERHEPVKDSSRGTTLPPALHRRDEKT